MRSSEPRAFVKVLSDPKKLAIITIVVFMNLGIFVLGRVYINPYLSRRPCVVCGRPDTKPVATLWQYQVNVIPVCKDVKLWYCKRHISNAPDLVTEIPSEKDTIAKRFSNAVIAGMLQMLTMLYAVVLLRFDIKTLFLSPVIIALSFILGHATSSMSLTMLFGSIVVVPGALFYLWQKKGKI